MTAPIIVVGHKNPDNDAISAAVGYAYLKNAIAKRDAKEGEPVQQYLPARLGPLPPETAKVFEENGIETPLLISNLHARVSDVMTPNPYSVSSDAPLLDAGRELRERNVRALVVNNQDGTCLGLLTQRMLAWRYISATDLVLNGSSKEAVANDLAASLDQKVEDLTEVDVLKLDEDALLRDAVDDLMASSLREALVLDKEGRAVGIVTRSDVTVVPRRKVILVDHNELRQAADGIEEAEVVEVIDHHRIADVSTVNPIKFLNLPVGSTATIVAMEFENSGIEMPVGIARVLLSAVMTDTVMLKSPTTTSVDVAVAERLGAIIGEDAVAYGMRVFKMRGGDADMPIEKFVGADSKEFELPGGGVVLIAQHETVDLDTCMEREQEIRDYMEKLRADHDYVFVLLMVTDILAEGSQFICEGDRRIVNKAFDITCTGQGGTWMPGVLSRKKQVAARVLDA
jgi:manganese-dependent inorganic pyrophosphatase